MQKVSGLNPPVAAFMTIIAFTGRTQSSAPSTNRMTTGMIDTINISAP